MITLWHIMNHLPSTLCYIKDVSMLYNQSKTATNWVHCDTHKQNHWLRISPNTILTIFSISTLLFYHFHFNSIILIFIIDCIPCAVTFENLKLYKCRTTERVTLEEISTREKKTYSARAWTNGKAVWKHEYCMFYVMWK